MKDFARFFVTYAGFWLVYFMFCRIAFVGYHGSRVAGFSASTVAGIFVYGAYADLSAACYLMVIPYFIWFANSLFPLRAAKPLLRIYSCFLVMVVAVISVADLQIYKEWGTKLNAQAISYLRFPKEAFASASSSPLLLLLLMAVGLAALGIFLYLRTPLRLQESPDRSLIRFPLFVLFAGFIFLGIRGGVGMAAMNPSFVYFSDKPFANHAALNSSWNLFYDIKYAWRERGIRYAFMSEAEMRRRVERITAKGEGNETEFILKNNRPNIVCIILESWTSDVVESMGGVPGLTPNLEGLIKQGLLFTGIYSSGNRTSYGIPSVLSGYPSLPDGSILDHPDKMEKLPVISQDLGGVGYSSVFYYGGDTRFDDMNSYFLHGGFQRVVDKSSFSASELSSKWGAQDQALYDRVLAEAGKMRQPFLVSMLTLSSHEPYEVPMATVIPGSDEASQFKNAMVYADRSLGDFFRKAAKEPWYRNTLFVLVADHGHRLPKGWGPQVPEKFHIPLLFFGEPLKESCRGTRRSFTGSQSDIAATILAQLGLPHDRYLWSNNLLNRHRNDYAFYAYNNGFGWRTDHRSVSFETIAGKVLLDRELRPGGEGSAETLRDGQAYLQYLAAKYAAF